MNAVLRTLLVLPVLLSAAACATLSPAEQARTAALVEAARSSELTCDRPDACARPSALHQLAARAFVESAPQAPRHYALLLDSGQDALVARLDLIRSATTSIDLQTYIFDEDDAGQLFIEELLAAARRGVRVRVLVDQLSALLSTLRTDPDIETVDEDIAPQVAAVFIAGGGQYGAAPAQVHFSVMGQGNGLNLRLQAVNLTSLVTGVVNSNAALAKNKEQQLNLSIEKDCMVYADPRKLTEIVDNLINNAIKYSPLGTAIHVQVKVKEEFGVIEVRDEGPGLTRDDKKNLYRRFTSLSAQPTGGENSTGLGLSIVKNLVDAHRGFIHATSDGPGTGSTFTVELPLSENC
mgnify:CR=1 FL=1